MEEVLEFEIIKHYPVERKYIILKSFEKGIMKRITELFFKRRK